MFDADISALIDGVEIDTPKNALSLAKSIHPALVHLKFTLMRSKVVAMSIESPAMMKLFPMPMDSHGM